MFYVFQEAIHKQMEKMYGHDLFEVGIDRDVLWEIYLKSFPEGTNNIFRERTEHDCSTCRNFVKSVGNMVAIVNGKIVTIWDIEPTGTFYDQVANVMSQLIKVKEIRNVFARTQAKYGVEKTHEALPDNELKTWQHFYCCLPASVVKHQDHIGKYLNDEKTKHDVFHRGLIEITDEAIDVVLDLISQNTLYRGEQYEFVVKKFKDAKALYKKVGKNPAAQDRWTWFFVKKITEPTARIRNSAIGTLLLDLSGDMDLEDAVKRYEAVMAPTNYKRPTALITKSMIKKAQETVEALGLTSALNRRYAVIEDITINNVLFADKKAQSNMAGYNVFEDLAETIPIGEKELERTEKITIQKFLTDVLPNVESMEVLLDNKHLGNLVSLIAPVDKEAKGLFQWPNPFSWAYANELADSVKQRVKQAGGNVDGDFRCSLSWFNTDDLDLHCIEPSGREIYYGNKKSANGGGLDVDMNFCNLVTNPVENITFPDRNKMVEGKYKFFVENFTKRNSSDVGFEVEMEFDGQIYHFGYEKAVATSKKITVVEFNYSRATGITIINGLKPTMASKEVWGLNTKQFVPVKTLMYSPNYWDGNEVGNRHYFFMLEGCQNPDAARGFFNEFLKEDLREHRKVFEVLGSKMKADPHDCQNQLSGLGFSSTQRNSIYCKVKGNFTRILEITF